MEVREKKVFSSFVKSFYNTIFICIITEIIGRYVSIYTVTVVGTATNSIIDRNFNYLKDNLVLLIVLLVISSILVPMFSFIYCKLYVKAGIRFDTSSYSKFLRQKRTLLDKYDAGEMVYRIVGDAIDYRGGLLNLVGDGAVVLFVIFQSFYVMSKLHMRFAVICLILSTLPILLVKCFDNKLKNLYTAEQETLSKIANSEKVVIENFDFIKTHILNNKVLKMFKEQYGQYYKIYKRKTIITTIIDNFKEFFFIACEILIYIIGSYYIASHQLTVGDGVKFFGLSIILKDNAKLLSKVLVNYFRFKASSKRYIEWTENEEVFESKQLDNMFPITCDNVNFKYNDIKAIDNLSFSINEGDHVVVEGKNGSGKSTLLKLLTGLYLDYEGHIYVNNCELKNLDINWLRENINVVNQNPFIFNSTVFDNIKYCCLSSMGEEIDEVLVSLGLYDIKDKVAGEDGEYLSGGQKQKISLARALVKDSEITILDEPDNALDMFSKEKIIDILSQSEKTIIVISHNSEWKSRFSNKIISL